MHTNKKKRLLEEVRRFRARFAHSVGTWLGDVIPKEGLLKAVLEEGRSYRDRIYSPFVMLSLFIEQVLGTDHSCQDAVARSLSRRVSLGQAPSSLNTGPYCKARSRLPLSLLVRLARDVASRLVAEQPSTWRWRGREVKLIDGTTVSMPDTQVNQARFPQPRSQAPGLGFPMARLVAIVSLSCGAVLEWAMGPGEGEHTGETALLWGLKERLSPGDVVVADRYYAGYFLIAALRLLGVDVVMRQHHLRHTDFRKGVRLGERDHLVDWARPVRPAWMDEATYAAMPEALTMREVRVGRRTLVTTMVDARDVPKAELGELYGRRWQIELDLRAIKVVMQMEILRCKTPAMVEKEVAAHLLAYNLVRAVMAQAACVHGLTPRQLSFKTTLQLLNAFEQALRHRTCSSLRDACVHLLAGIARTRLAHRPDRVEPRAIKRRPRQHWLLTKPRWVMRERLSRRKIATRGRSLK